MKGLRTNLKANADDYGAPITQKSLHEALKTFKRHPAGYEGIVSPSDYKRIQLGLQPKGPVFWRCM